MKEKVVVYMDVDKTWGWRYYDTSGHIAAKSYDAFKSDSDTIKAVKDVIKGDPKIEVAAP